MFQSPADEAAKLEDEIQRSMSAVGTDQVSVDLGAVSALVRKRKKGAEHYVDVLCAQAARGSHRLQMAQLVAVAYAVEFDDQRLIHKVAKTAKDLGLPHL